MDNLASQVIAWHKDHGRHQLPWQISRTPYRVWVSEIMLQQTQVQTVIPYYQRFVHTCPTVESLATLQSDDLMLLWEGLGYYTRARNLHKAAKMIISDFGGRFPATHTDIIKLPGIGRTTAAAIMSLSYNKPDPILDGNVKRVLCRFHGIKSNPRENITLKKLWNIAESHITDENPQAYTQGMMDLGANVCTRTKPACLLCPLSQDCYAFQNQMTSQLPVRTKRATPKPKDLFVLLYINNGKVGLVKRETGIWSGLYAPVIYNTYSELTKAYPQALPLEQYKHKLTHLDLTIYPFVVNGSSDIITHWEEIHNITLATPTGMNAAIKQLYTCIHIENNIP